jgi:hypothetical protein
LPTKQQSSTEALVRGRSYLGYGLMAGRAAVLSWEQARAANPCVLADHQGTYEYGGIKYDLVPHPAGAGFAACSKLVKLVLRQELDCGAPKVRALAPLVRPSFLLSVRPSVLPFFLLSIRLSYLSSFLSSFLPFFLSFPRRKPCHVPTNGAVLILFTLRSCF